MKLALRLLLRGLDLTLATAQLAQQGHAAAKRYLRNVRKAIDGTL